MTGPTDQVSRIPARRIARDDELDPLNESLRQRERRYRSLVTATPQIVWTTNPEGEVVEVSLDPLAIMGPDGEITHVNETTEVGTGCPRAELVGTNLSGLVFNLSERYPVASLIPAKHHSECVAPQCVARQGETHDEFHSRHEPFHDRGRDASWPGGDPNITLRCGASRRAGDDGSRSGRERPDLRERQG